MERGDFIQMSVELGVEMKRNNTIVDKWPTQLKLKLGQEGTEEDFDLLLGSGCVDMERDAEWKRVT